MVGWKMVSPGEETHCRKTLELNTRREAMMLLRRAALMLLVFLVGTLMVISQSQAGVSSHKINAKSFGQYDIATGGSTAQIIGGGLLHGTVVGSWQTTGFQPPDILLGISTQTITTSQGATLTVELPGFFNLTTGEYIISGGVTDATGRLTGATGNLMFEGVQSLETGMYVETITGIIFVDLAP